MASINLDPATSAGQDAAASASGMFDSVVAVMNDPQTLAIVMGVVGLPFAGAYAYRLFASDDESFDKKPLKDIVRPRLVKVAERVGYEVKTELKRDFYTVGEVWKMCRFTEKSDLHEHDNVPNNVQKDIDYTISDDVKKQLAESGEWTEEQLDRIEKGMIPHRLLVMRPADVVGKFAWFFIDRVAGMRKFTHYYLVPESKVMDGKYIMVDKHLQFREFAGILVPMTFESMGVLHSVVFRALYESALEDQANYHKQVNYYAAEHSQRMQEIEKELEAELASRQGKLEDIFG